MSCDANGNIEVFVNMECERAARRGYGLAGCELYHAEKQQEHRNVYTRKGIM